MRIQTLTLFIVILIKSAIPQEAIFYCDDSCFFQLSDIKYMDTLLVIKSDRNLRIAKKIINCECFDNFTQYDSLRARLREMIASYDKCCSEKARFICNDLFTSINAKDYFEKISRIPNLIVFEYAKKIIDSCDCDCWLDKQGEDSTSIKRLFKKIHIIVEKFEHDWPIIEETNKIDKELFNLKDSIKRINKRQDSIKRAKN